MLITQLQQIPFTQQQQAKQGDNRLTFHKIRS